MFIPIRKTWAWIQGEERHWDRVIAIISLTVNLIGLVFVISTYLKYKNELDYSLTWTKITPLVTWASRPTSLSANGTDIAQISITPESKGKYIPRVWRLGVIFTKGVTVENYDKNWKQSSGMNIYTFKSTEPLIGLGGGSYFGDVYIDRAGWFDISVPAPDQTGKSLIGIFQTAGDRVDGVTQAVYFDFINEKFVYDNVNFIDGSFPLQVSTSSYSHY